MATVLMSAQFIGIDILKTEPMNRTSPESTKGLVVNHSQRKAEANLSKYRHGDILSPELTESRNGLNCPFTAVSADIPPSLPLNLG
jgi:hypothetical protein